MAKHRKEQTAAGSIKLRQPVRGAPTEKTLLDFAQEQNLFQQADRRQAELRKQRGEEFRQGTENDDDGDDDDDKGKPKDADAATLSPGAERFMEAALWTVSLTMLHFTFDVLVQHQYGIEVIWPSVWTRAAKAWLGFLFIFYVLHPHESNATLVPRLPARFQHRARQSIFFFLSVISGCYLIHISNSYGYLATMKQAPPVACLWLWAVMELDLLPAVLSLAFAVVFLWQRGYGIK
ncbi:deacetylase-like protein [Drechmeria coniospora]|uniref:Deacetylase-like protein n=1 Tax=Drechmeria coniospora TaxID=98403 RepID=A0A151GHS4_DRECN|nr:deacetylase-like protein [Drechmeria coniospora]KYK56630.1 deacetylase-like protein [Drechmeria coniospora]